MQTFNKICIFISLAALILYRVVFWWLHPLTIWSDQSVYLAMGQLILAGRVPYCDFFDFNTPLIIYLSTLPSIVSTVMAMPVTLAFVMTVYALLAFSIWLIWRLFDCNKSDRHYALRWAIIFAFVIFTQLQKSDFGQREHIFVLLFVPYVILRCLRLEGGVAPSLMAMLIGCCAAVGTNIKPLFIEIFIVFELVLLRSGSNLRNLLAPECRVFITTSLLYAIAFLFLPQAAKDVFFNQALPVYTNGLAAFSNSIIAGLDTDAAFSVPVYLMVALLLVASVLQSKSRWILPLSTLVIVSFVIYLQAGLVWTYRMMPMEASLALLGGLEAGLLWQHIGGNARTIGKDGNSYSKNLISLIFCPIFSASVVLFSWNQIQTYLAEIKTSDMFAMSNIGYGGQCPESDLDAVFYTILKHTTKKDSVVVIGPTVLPGYPAVLLSGRHYGSRYLHGMVLPMLHFCRQNHPDDKKFEILEKETIQNYGSDITANKPTLVFIADDFVRPQLDSYNFVPKYLSSYQSLGHLHQFKYEVFKLQENNGLKSNPENWPVEKRRDLVLKILNETITSKNASAQSGLSQSQIDNWVKRAEQALDQSLADNPGGGEIELKSQVLDSMAREKALEDKVKALEGQVQYLKSHNLKSRPRD